MEFDSGHQQLKAQLMAAFDRASRSVDSTHKKTRLVNIVMQEEEEKKEDSRLFRLTQRFNGARLKLKQAEDEETSEAANEGDDVPETTQ